MKLKSIIEEIRRFWIRRVIRRIAGEQKKLLIPKEAKMGNFGGKLCSFINKCEQTIYDAGYGNCIIKVKRETICNSEYDLVTIRVRYGV